MASTVAFELDGLMMALANVLIETLDGSQYRSDRFILIAKCDSWRSASGTARFHPVCDI